MPQQNIIYVLVNQSFPDWIKIGRCSDLEERVKKLSSNTAVPLPFEVFYACEVSDGPSTEKKLFQIFEDYRVSAKREFFAVDPEKVVQVLSIASPQEIRIDETFETDSLIEKARKDALMRDGKFAFADANVSLGSEINLTRFPHVRAVVVDQHTVLYEGEKWDFTELTKHLISQLTERASLQLSAPRYWSFEGEMLVVRKNHSFR